MLLEDCGHIIHRESMDEWMRGSIVENEVVIKNCPKCSTPVSRSVRYGNIIKERLQKVLRIRKKIFGNDEHQRAMQEALVDDLTRRGNRFTFNVFRDWLQNMLCEFQHISFTYVNREIKKVSREYFNFNPRRGMISNY